MPDPFCIHLLKRADKAQGIIAILHSCSYAQCVHTYDHIFQEFRKSLYRLKINQSLVMENCINLHLALLDL